jgi:hypothetical protein
MPSSFLSRRGLPAAQLDTGEEVNMASPGKPGGFLIQSNFGTKGNFEMVVPHTTMPFVSLASDHYWRNNDAGGAWRGPLPVASNPISGASLIQSNFGIKGNLELVVCEGSNLVHYWRMDKGPWTWSKPIPIGTDVKGNPSLIQSNFGSKGNFELVVPHVQEGFVHFWRDNDDPKLPWHGPFHFGGTPISGLALIQSNYGTKGYLEVVACEGNTLAHYQRLDKAPWTWNRVATIATGVQGTPALIQSTLGSKGNFEVVVPRTAGAGGGLAHYSGALWTVKTFGSGDFDLVSLIQSNYGTQGNFEVVAREGGMMLMHFWCNNDAGGVWSAGTPIP